MGVKLSLRKLRKYLYKKWGYFLKEIAAKREQLRKNVKRILKYCRFLLRYHRIRLKNRSIYFIKKYIFTSLVWSSLYFFLLALVSYFAGNYIDIATVEKQKLTYFATAAAMVGGILAIVFSFKTLIIQNAAENLSAGFYRTLAKDKRQDFVFFILVFTVVVFFTLGLASFTEQFSLFNKQYDLLRFVFQLSIFVIGFDLYLVFLLYQLLFNKIDPFSGISSIQKSSVEFLDEIYQKATEFADLMLLHPKTDKKTTKEEMLASTFQSFRTDLQYLSYRLNYLFDYHDKVLAKNERTASLTILDVIASILEKYFIIRRDSSVLLPSGFFFVSSSDSQAFLTPHLESLVAVGENYLKREDSVGVRKIITLFQELVGYAGEIKFLRARTPDNPILMQCRGYLDQFMKSVIQKGFFEGMYQGALTYKAIGAYITRKKMIHEITPVYDTLDKITFAALLKRQDVVVTEVLNTYSALITVLMEDYWLFEQKLDLILEHIQQIVLLGFTVYKTRSIPDNRMQQDLAKPYETLMELIMKTVSKTSSLTGEKKREAKSAILEAAEQLRSSLRYLSENLKNADHLLIHSLALVTEQVGCLMISLTDNPEWNDEKQELIKQAGWYIHQPKWFTHDVTKIEDNLNFDALTEAVAKMGFVAIEKNQDDIADEATKIITQFATEMLEKEAGNRYGFTEPRIMVLACYIGVYAMKQGKTAIVSKLKERIKTFEEAYRKKWFPDPRADQLTSPKRNQLMIEVMQFMDNLTDLNRVRDPFQNTKELILDRVTVDDAKKFIKEIWNLEVK